MRLIELIQKLTDLPGWMQNREVSIGILDESYDIEIVDDGEIELQPVGFYDCNKKVYDEVAGELECNEIKKIMQQQMESEAEQLFDRMVEETGKTAAAALLQSGRLAEDRLDYRKALRNYAGAVALAPDNPDYLLPAWQMACKMGEYQRAEEWLEHLLAILNAR